MNEAMHLHICCALLGCFACGFIKWVNNITVGMLVTKENALCHAVVICCGFWCACLGFAHSTPYFVQHGCDKCPGGPQTFTPGVTSQTASTLITSALLKTPLSSPHKARDVTCGPCSSAASPDKAAVSSSAISSPSSRCCGSPAVERLLLGISTVGLQDPGAHSCAVPCPGAPHTTPTSPARHALDICSTASEVTSAQILPAQQAAQADAPAGVDTTLDWPCDEADPGDNPIVLGTNLFFARVPPTVSYESILELFTQFGTVLTLNLFRPWATAKTSKVRMFERGCLALDTLCGHECPVITMARYLRTLHFHARGCVGAVQLSAQSV